MNESRSSQAKCLKKQEQLHFIEEGTKIILKKQNHYSKRLQLTQTVMENIS